MERKRVVLFCSAAGLAFALLMVAIVFGSGIWGESPPQPGVTKLKAELPDGYSVVSYAVYNETLVLLCYNEEVIGPQAYALLSYRSGDADFSVHPITLIPYTSAGTSLQVVEDKLFIFYTKAFGGDYTTYRSYVQTVNIDSWTVGGDTQIYLPPTLSPGMVVSHGKDLYVLGGLTTNKTSPYQQNDINDTVYRADVTTGRVEVLANVPGISDKAGVFIEDRLALFNGGFAGQPRTDYSSYVSWGPISTLNYSTGSYYSSEGAVLLSSGALPAVDGDAAYFFNPGVPNYTTYRYDFTHQIVKMKADGSFVLVNLTLPSNIGSVVPVRFGSGFLLLNQTTSFDGQKISYKIELWFCYLKGCEELPMVLTL